MPSLSRVWAAAASVAATVIILASGANVEPPVLAKRATDRAVGTTLASTTALDVEYSAWYDSSSCSGTPFLLYAVAVCMTYSSEGCSLYDLFSYSASGAAEPVDTYYEEGCSDDWGSVPDKLYGDDPFLRIDYYADADCSEFDSSTVSLADGECHAYSGTDELGYIVVSSVLTTINANGSATRSYYDNGDCSGEAGTVIPVDAILLSSRACDGNGSIAYTNAFTTGNAGDNTTDEEDDEDPASVGDDEADDDGGLSTGAIIGIVVGAVAFVAIIAGLIVWCRRRSSGDTYREMPAATQ